MNVTDAAGTFALHTPRDIRRFIERRRRIDRSLTSPQGDEGSRVAESVPDGPQASTSLDPSAEPSDEHVRLARLTAHGIVGPFVMARRVG